MSNYCPKCGASLNTGGQCPHACEQMPRKTCGYCGRQNDGDPCSYCKKIVDKARAERVRITTIDSVSVRRLQDLLVSTGLVHEDAIEDPEGYDGGLTIGRIAKLAKELNDESD